MSLKVIKCEATWSEFKRNVALTKSRNMSAIYGSSILLQHDPPRCSNPSSRRRKRSPSSKRRKRSPSIYNEEGANGEPASKPRSFTKELRSKCTIHTAQCCRLFLPAVFCRKHKVERSVTMTDSRGHKLWHMCFQPWGWFRHPRMYIISNGWREFSYDHGLKLHDRLVFTLVSSSHFTVEFATSNGSTCAMLPTRNRKNYPWQITYSRLDFLASLNNVDSSKVQLQAVKEKHIRKKLQVVKERENREKVASVILRSKQKAQKEFFCQCDTVKVENGKNITNYSRKEFVFPEFTHLECKYPDGSPYLQIIDSDSEISGLDED